MVKESQKHEMFWKDQIQFYIAGYYDDVWSDGNLGFGLVNSNSQSCSGTKIHDRMIYFDLDADMGKKSFK